MVFADLTSCCVLRTRMFARRCFAGGGAFCLRTCVIVVAQSYLSCEILITSCCDKRHRILTKMEVNLHNSALIRPLEELLH